MITHKGTMPFCLWWNVKVEEFEKKIHRNIVNEVMAGVLEDAQYGIKDAAVTYLYEGVFKIVAFKEDTDLSVIGAELNEIIEEYELEDY